jgi:hypothetical protein
MIVPFKAQHMVDFEVQSMQAAEASILTQQEAMALENTTAYSLFEEGRILACFGMIEVWAGRSIGWSYVSQHIGRRYVKLHRAALRVIDMCEWRRLETYVDVDFAEGHRWARMLGFQLEIDRMRNFRPYGMGDSAMYVRIR